MEFLAVDRQPRCSGKRFREVVLVEQVGDVVADTHIDRLAAAFVPGQVLDLGKVFQNETGVEMM